MDIHITFIGFILIPLSLIHIIFPKYFDWNKELSTLSLINRQMIYVHTFFIAFIIFLMGILCLSSASDLTHTDLGKKISLGLGIFWLLRLYIQFFGYSPNLWKGKKFETAVHVCFSLMWGYMSFIFIMTYFQ
jgi:hypothetical protein